MVMQIMHTMLCKNCTFYLPSLWVLTHMKKHLLLLR
nr:MAG TPA: Cytochrome c oxidase subunit 1 [Caudoviricetes sp.]